MLIKSIIFITKWEKSNHIASRDSFNPWFTSTEIDWVGVGGRQREKLINERRIEISKIEKALWEGWRREKKEFYQIDLKILPCHLLEWYSFKPVRKWKHSPNQPLRQWEKLATSGLLTPEMYQPHSVLPYTIHFLLERVQRCDHHETELGQPVQSLSW